MPKIKLTESAIGKLKVPDGKRDEHYWDTVTVGLAVRCYAGGKKSYIAKCQLSGGQQRKVALGPVERHNLEDARKWARQILAAADRGEDLVAEKREAAKKKTATLGSLVEPYLKAREPELRPASMRETARYLRRAWMPLHELQVEIVTRQDVVATLAEIEEHAGKVSADRSKAALGAFYAWCIDRGYCNANPVISIKRRAPSGGRERTLTERELVEVWRAAGDDDHGRIIKALILTAQRKTEIADAQWNEIDAERREIRLDGGRTKNKRAHVVPLSSAALHVIGSVIRRNDRAFLFGEGKRGFQGWSMAKRRLDKRLAGKVEGWTLHDIRRSVVTAMHENGLGQPAHIEALVNHVSGAKSGVAGVYDRSQHLEARRRLVEAWGAYFLGLVDGDGKIVPLRAAG
jgi:integrase